MKKKGFTLVELLVVIVLIALLAILVLPNVLSAFKSSRYRFFISEAQNIYKTAKSQYALDSVDGSSEITYETEAGVSIPGSKKLDVSKRSGFTYTVIFNGEGDIIYFKVEDNDHKIEIGNDSNPVAFEDIADNVVVNTDESNSSDPVCVGNDCTTPEILCPSGQYYLEDSCVPCPNGYYCSGSAKTACPAGYKGKGTGRSTLESGCVKCVAGTYSPSEGSTTCTVCETGTYNIGLGNTSCSSNIGTLCPAGQIFNTTSRICENCPTGSYCESGDTTPTACPAGTYTDTTGNTSCTACPAGTYNTGTGNTSCTSCENGYYCSGGSSKTACPAGKKGTGVGRTSEANGCAACETGSYSTAPASTTCQTCEDGSYNVGTGNTACFTDAGTLCEPGKYLDSASNTCKDCPAGSYCPSGSSTHIACPAGTYSGPGSATCTTCAAGTYNTGTGNTTCKTCENGYYCAGGSDRTGCPVGHKGTGTGKTSQSNGCSLCEVGTYSDSIGSTSCTACAAGKYTSSQGNTSCKTCEDGYYCPGGTRTACPAGTEGTGTGKTSQSAGCSACAAGKYSSSDGSATCSTCAAGTYNTTTGQTTCKNCEIGYYCAGGNDHSACPAGYRGTGSKKTTISNGCSACATGSYSNTPASTTCTLCESGSYNTGSGNTSCTTDTGTLCEAGKYFNTSTNNCETCPAGYYCPAGASDKIICAAGTYSSAGKTACSTCPAGTYSNTPGTANSCKTCENGYYCTGGSNRTSCPVGTKGNGTGKTTRAEGCVSCAAGTYSDELASTTCKTCAAGTYTLTMGHASCSTCESGYYCEGGTSHTACPAGYEGTGTGKKTQAAACQACSAGTYSSNQGTATCSTCAAGTYNVGNGNVSCITCEDGYYCAGSTSHNSCPIGYEGTGEGKSTQSEGCSACANGYYSNTVGSASCSVCPSGSSNTGTGNTSCTFNEVTTTCTAGQYYNGSSCVICPANYYCPGDSEPIACPTNRCSSEGSSSATACSLKNCAEIVVDPIEQNVVSVTILENGNNPNFDQRGYFLNNSNTMTIVLGQTYGPAVPINLLVSYVDGVHHVTVIPSYPTNPAYTFIYPYITFQLDEGTFGPVVVETIQGETFQLINGNLS